MRACNGSAGWRAGSDPEFAGRELAGRRPAAGLLGVRSPRRRLDRGLARRERPRCRRRHRPGGLLGHSHGFVGASSTAGAAAVPSREACQGTGGALALRPPAVLALQGAADVAKTDRDALLAAAAVAATQHARIVAPVSMNESARYSRSSSLMRASTGSSRRQICLRPSLHGNGNLTAKYMPSRSDGTSFGEIREMNTTAPG